MPVKWAMPVQAKRVLSYMPGGSENQTHGRVDGAMALRDATVSATIRLVTDDDASQRPGWRRDATSSTKKQR
tara:strand:+ start:604 stop:819 length:216 start_codon:yes stop_codon:yes gene_type:complete